MITELDMDIAKRMAARWRGHHRFDNDDAFQSAIENLIRVNPKDPGLRVLAMRSGISRALTRDAFTMSVPRSSFDRMRKEDRLPDHLGDLIVDDLVFEIPEEDQLFQEVEDYVLVQHLLAKLNDKQRKVVERFMVGGRVSVASQTRPLLDEALNQLREGAFDG